MREKRGRGRFFALLISLVVLFLLYPVMVELEGVRLFRLFFILLLVSAVVTLSDKRRQLIVAIVLAVPTALAQAAVLAYPDSRILVVATALALLFVSYVTVVIFAAVLTGDRVTGDKIAGAVCVYLLLGLAWAMVYGITALFDPAAFDAPPEMRLADAVGGGEYTFIYYSFVTLTTLGYGDIFPLSSFARTFAWIEAMTGQLFIAILVARLVALHIVHGAQPDRDS